MSDSQPIAECPIKWEHAVIPIPFRERGDFLSEAACSITSQDFGAYAGCQWIGFYLPGKEPVCGGENPKVLQETLYEIAARQKQDPNHYILIGPCADSTETQSTRGEYTAEGGKHEQEQDASVNLDESVLTNALARLQQQLASDPTTIPGYVEFKDFPYLGFDAEEFEFFTADCDYKTLDTRLAEEFGSDYSLRYHIVTINP